MTPGKTWPLPHFVNIMEQHRVIKKKMGEMMHFIWELKPAPDMYSKENTHTHFFLFILNR